MVDIGGGIVEELGRERTPPPVSVLEATPESSQPDLPEAGNF